MMFKKLEQNQCSNDATNNYKKMVDRVQEMTENAGSIITNRAARTKLNENISYMSDLSACITRMLQHRKQQQQSQNQSQPQNLKRKQNSDDDSDEAHKKYKLEDPRKTALSQNTKGSLILPASKIVPYKVNKESEDEGSGYECSSENDSSDSESEN